MKSYFGRQPGLNTFAAVMMNNILTTYRKSFAGLPTPVWYLSLVMLVNRSGTMVVPFMTMYLTQHVGVSIGKAGLVMAFFGVGAVCGSLLGGWLTDKTGFYRVQLFTLIGGGVFFIILGQIRDFSLICAFTFLLSLVNEAFRPANQTAIAFYSVAANRTRSFTLSRLAINLGWSVGGALGGFLAGYNYDLLFWVDGITNILAGLLLLVLLPWQGQVAANKAAIENSREKAPPVYADRQYLKFAFLTFIFAICFFQLFSTQPVFFKASWHLSEQTVGYVIALNGLIIALFEMPIIMYFEGRVNVLRMIAAGTAMVGLSFAMLNWFTPGVVLALASTVVMTAGEMCSMPFMNTYWTSRSVHANRGQYAALYTTAYSLAHVAGPFTGAQIAEQMGFNVLWWMVGGLTMLAALGYLLLRDRSKII